MTVFGIEELGIEHALAFVLAAGPPCAGACATPIAETAVAQW